jgi:hypothetical protein
VYARSVFRLGRGKCAQMFVLRRAVNEREPERGTTLTFFVGRGSGPCNCFNLFFVPVLEEAFSVGLGTEAGLLIAQASLYFFLALEEIDLGTTFLFLAVSDGFEEKFLYCPNRPWSDGRIFVLPETLRFLLAWGVMTLCGGVS